MEREICKLQKTLEDGNCQPEASASAATKVDTKAKENNNNNVPVVDVDGDDVVDGSDSATVCGVLQEDGTTCTTAPVIGRKRCTEHKGQRISCLPPAKTYRVKFLLREKNVERPRRYVE
ncbi:unnamed protein product [Eruca vesicaria subsp. sativa]|uniref:Uncharacterized protein n=1 Tax=Eruca vesicaria subsp. sativa TaxID=29727 RepID=A0ABC8JLH4_ERUVS|nr:unnamed protein product [Eruca vesicaria subsp. sativa]